MIAHLALAGGAVLVLALALWVLSLALRDSSIVDIAWGPLIACVALIGLMVGEGWGPRRALVAALVCAWALRLALHIAVRNHGRGEDPRYAAWRAQYGSRWPVRSLYHVFLLQGVLLLLVSAPVFVAQNAATPATFTAFDFAGSAVWLAGFLIESASDAQLLRFRRTSRPGAILTDGLWKYSRHPNYFGEAVLWWGLGLVALPHHVLAFAGPLLLNWLLVRVSGVRMTEARMAARPGYAEYVRRTNAFLPWRAR